MPFANCRVIGIFLWLDGRAGSISWNSGFFFSLNLIFLTFATLEYHGHIVYLLLFFFLFFFRRPALLFSEPHHLQPSRELQKSITLMSIPSHSQWFSPSPLNCIPRTSCTDCSLEAQALHPSEANACMMSFDLRHLGWASMSLVLFFTTTRLALWTRRSTWRRLCRLMWVIFFWLEVLEEGQVQVSWVVS